MSGGGHAEPASAAPMPSCTFSRLAAVERVPQLSSQLQLLDQVYRMSGSSPADFRTQDRQTSRPQQKKEPGLSDAPGSHTSLGSCHLISRTLYSLRFVRGFGAPHPSWWPHRAHPHIRPLCGSPTKAQERSSHAQAPNPHHNPRVTDSAN